MSDNTRINPGTGGDNIATEDIGTYKIPVVKIRTGALDVDGGDVTATNPLATQLSQGNALLTAFNPIPTQLSQGNNPLTAINPIPAQLSQGNALLSATNPIPTQLSQGNLAVAATNPVPAQLSVSNVVASSTNPVPTQLSQGNALISALNPIPTQLSVGNVVASLTNPVPMQLSQGNAAVSSSNPLFIQTARLNAWSVVSTPAVATQATATKAAGTGTVRHVCTTISVSFTGTAANGPILVNLRDGASGLGNILWSEYLTVPAANEVRSINVTDLYIVGSTLTAMTLEFASAGGANTFQSVTLSGYDIS